MPQKLTKDERKELSKTLSSTELQCIEEAMKLYQKNNADPAIEYFVEYTGNMDTSVILSDYSYSEDIFKDGLIRLLAGAQADKKMAAREKEEEGKEDFWEEFEKYVGNSPEDRARELFDRMHRWEVKLVNEALELAHQGNSAAYETASYLCVETMAKNKSASTDSDFPIYLQFPTFSKSSDTPEKFKKALLGFYTSRLR
ncbi:hypothetical protein VFPPC_13599 [Pochonia chlamydosporia 170]|uniref:Uncharacterized protein n=1 Tax=Pochonia chlamydosporia 170 TaxID=1380566 RepID=A0A179FQP2_METCM|nr:hypothetical protein VFPPC_13599 [Pochonia chlamydosporia 170]OAQ67936.1 hypothetical protein VFPPC_13599 [Pochonia chlamydosporia 170]